MRNTTPLWSCLRYHWSILPSRYRRTVPRTSEHRIGIHMFGVALAAKLPIARSLVVGTARTEDAGASTGAVAWAREIAGLISTRAAARAMRLAGPIRLTLPRPVSPVTTASPLRRLPAYRFAANVPLATQ